MAPGYRPMAVASASLIAFPEEVEATSRTMLALGAIAWAYSTSRDVSMDHPNSSCVGFRKLVLIFGQLPLPQSIVKLGGAGILKNTSKKDRSLAIVGLPKASTITIVWPLPSRLVG